MREGPPAVGGVDSLDAINKVKQYRRDLPTLCAGHLAVVEAAMLCCQRKHSSDLYLENVPSPLPLHVPPLLQSIVHGLLQLLHQVTAEDTAGQPYTYSCMYVHTSSTQASHWRLLT